jgi:hypothetical protein
MTEANPKGIDVSQLPDAPLSANDQYVFVRLLRVQRQLRVPKSQVNSFGHYNYRSLEDITEAAKPICAENGLLFNLTDEIATQGDRYYVCACASVTDVLTGKSIRSFGYAREAEHKTGMDDAQLTGACSSYARKYACNGLFAIDDVKDSDTQDNREKPETQASLAKPETKKPYTKPAKKPYTKPVEKPMAKPVQKATEDLKGIIMKQLADKLNKAGLTDTAVIPALYAHCSKLADCTAGELNYINNHFDLAVKKYKEKTANAN